VKEKKKGAYFCYFLLIWKDKVFCLHTQKWDKNHVVHGKSRMIG